jgi:hypothetical protein
VPTAARLMVAPTPTTECHPFLMHTTRDLSSASFSIQVEGRAASFDAVFGHFSERDRIGVVVRRPCGAVGASALILASITAFYDIQRSRYDEFFIYPDYYVFHVDRRLGDHRRLDIWPPHKEVVVRDDSEELLRAINDRGVTRLLVDDRPPRQSELQRESLASAHNRIATALAYAPAGRANDHDVQITGNAVTESYVGGVLEQSITVSQPDRLAVRSARRGLIERGRPVEAYRRLSLDGALALL